MIAEKNKNYYEEFFFHLSLIIIIASIAFSHFGNVVNQSAVALIALEKVPIGAVHLR